MAMDIINAKKVTENGLLSKIEIGGKVYEIKDLIARESIEELAELLDVLSGKVGEVEDGENLAALIAALEEAVKALQDNKADKTQVATDIEAAVKAEADIARAAEKANADAIALVDKAAKDNATEIARVDTALKAAIENDGEGLDSIKELATWIETHGPEAKAMSEAITKNAEDIADLQEADIAIDGRLDVIEAALGEGEGSVAEQIADAKDAAIEAAKDYTDDREVEITKAYVAADKVITDSLKALAYKDSATGTVAGETISGVKATGNGVTGVTLSDTANEKDINSNGKFTPAGNITGTVTPSGSVAVTVSTSAADATLTKGDYTPAGSVSVTLNGNTFNAITGVGTQASFTEGEFKAATLESEDVTANYATEGIVGSVEDETLTFTAAGIQALTATKVTAFNGGSKAADTFVANSLPTMAEQTVGVQNAAFTGTLAEDLVVTGVSYAKANAEAAATFTGDKNDIAATFAGTEGDIAVAGKYTDTTYTAAATTGAIELAVGDIKVATKDVTVQ